MTIEALRQSLADRYRIERQLGQGGMATVYLAEDLKHDRRVAIKVLKPELAAVLGAERFVVEIKTTAQLQHPHILPLFDSGSADGFLYYVMPYIEGETLRSKLDREKQLSVEEAVKITTEVADALDYAHRHGVVHRDIKPENILLHDGRPMVADFGIALAVSAAAGGRMTETGLSLGTPHYMSPEQATAEKDITGRSDIYSLGAVLYEMLTGDPPHTGASAQQIIMKIITEPVAPVTDLRKSVPPNVAAALAQALEKLPADRFASAKAFADALVNPAFTAPSAAPASVVMRRSRRTIHALAATTLVAIAAAVWGWLRNPPVPREIAARFSVLFAPGQGLAQMYGTRITIAPDGRSLVFLGMSAVGDHLLFLRRLNEIEPRALPGTEEAYNPVFSPDGRWIAFVAKDKVKKIDLATNHVTVVAPLPRASQLVNGLAWGDDDTLLAIQAGLWRIPGSGGTPTELRLADTAATGTPLSMFWPDILPGSRAALVNVNDGAPRLELLSLRSGKRTVLLDGNYVARYAPPGYLLIQGSDQAVSAMPFDLDRRRITGTPVALLPGIGRGVSGSGDFDVSGNGVLVFTTGAPRQTIVRVDRTGRDTMLLEQSAIYRDPRVSPDGRLLAYAESYGERGDIWLYDLARTTSTRLTFESDNFYPTWTPDGKRIAFTSRRAGPADIFSLPADGSGGLDTLYRSSFLSFPGSFAPDGRTLLFRQTTPTSGFDLLEVTIGDSAGARTVLKTRFNEAMPALSPDGRLLAYVSDETGRNEVYLRGYPGGEGRWAVSVNGGSEPVWRRDGRELFFRNGSSFFAVPVRYDNGPAPRLGRVDSLFSGPYERNSRWAEYDVMPDGRHFVMVLDSASSVQLQVATRWTDLLSEPTNAGGR